MHDQPKYIPLRPSSFFGDGRSERPLIAEYYQRVFGQDLPESVVGKAG